MALPKPLIFIHPLSDTLQKLYEIMSENADEEGIEIFDCEDEDEAEQLIAVSGPCLILSSEIKKMAHILMSSKKIIKKFHSKVLLISKKDLPRKTLIKLQKIGLTELVVEPVPPKSLIFKTRMLARALPAKKTLDEELDEQGSDKVVMKKSVKEKKEDDGPQLRHTGDQEEEDEDDVPEIKASKTQEQDKTKKKKSFHDEKLELEDKAPRRRDEKKENAVEKEPEVMDMDDDMNTDDNGSGIKKGDKDGDFKEKDLGGHYGKKDDSEEEEERDFDEEEDDTDLDVEAVGLKKLDNAKKEPDNDSDEDIEDDELDLEEAKRKSLANKEDSDLDDGDQTLAEMDKDLDVDPNRKKKKENKDEDEDEEEDDDHDLDTDLDLDKDKEDDSELEDEEDGLNKISSNNSSEMDFDEDEDDQEELDEDSLEGQKKKGHNPFDEDDEDDEHHEDLDPDLDLEKKKKNNSYEEEEDEEEDNKGPIDLDPEEEKEKEENHEEELEDDEKERDLEESDLGIEKKKRQEDEHLEGIEKKKRKKEIAGLSEEEDELEDLANSEDHDLDEDKEVDTSADEEDDFMERDPHEAKLELDLEEEEDEDENNDDSSKDYDRDKFKKLVDDDWGMKQQKSEKLSWEKKKKGTLDLDYGDDKDLGEQTINYAKLYEEFDGNFGPDSPKDELLPKPVDDEGPEDDEEIESDHIYEPDSKGLEHAMYIRSLYSDKRKSAEDCFEYITTTIHKELNGETKFFLFNKKAKKLNDLYFHETYLIKEHPEILEDWAELEKEYLDKWQEIPIQKWSDETFQEKEIQFVYPYYEGILQMGMAVIIFKEGFLGEKASKAEILLESCRGIYLEQIRSKGIKGKYNEIKKESKEEEKKVGFFGRLFGKKAS